MGGLEKIIGIIKTYNEESSTDDFQKKDFKWLAWPWFYLVGHLVMQIKMDGDYAWAS